MDLPVKTYFSPPEAAAYTRLPLESLDTLRSRGGGPRFIKRPGGKRILYRKVELDAWLIAGLRGITSEPQPATPVRRRPQMIEYRPADNKIATRQVPRYPMERWRAKALLPMTWVRYRNCLEPKMPRHHSCS